MDLSLIARDKRNGGKFHRHLRQGYKSYCRGKAEQVPTIKNAVSIDKKTRLSIAENGLVTGKMIRYRSP
jgi:hypothetical protein